MRVVIDHAMRTLHLRIRVTAQVERVERGAGAKWFYTGTHCTRESGPALKIPDARPASHDEVSYGLTAAQSHQASPGGEIRFS